MKKLWISAVAFTGLLGMTTLSVHAAQSQNIHVQAPQPIHDQAVTLGAGDQLGRACFSKYVTVVRIEQRREIREAAAPAVKPAHRATALVAQADESTGLHTLVSQVLDRVLVKVGHNA